MKYIAAYTLEAFFFEKKYFPLTYSIFDFTFVLEKDTDCPYLISAEIISSIQNENSGDKNMSRTNYEAHLGKLFEFMFEK